MRTLTLNRTEYDLTKIKEEDESIFLHGCQIWGSIKKKKGFINKLIDFIWYSTYPFYSGMPISDEYRIAYSFFKRRSEVKEKEELKKKLKEWRVQKQ